VRKEALTLLFEVGSFRGTQQSRCLPPHLWKGTDQISETLCSLVFRIPDDGQSENKISNSECYILSSEFFRNPHLRQETDPVFETLCSVVFRIPDDEQSLKI
jgi:hypothetical protein